MFLLTELLLPERQAPVLAVVDEQEDQISTQAYRKQIDKGIHIPAKQLGEGGKYRKRGVAGSYKEHIHMLMKTELNQTVQTERDQAQRKESAGGTAIVGALIAAPFGKADEKANEHQ